jgi:hypothetical protein
MAAGRPAARCAEYVIGDMISPVKSAVGPGYDELDKRLAAAVHIRFGLPLAVTLPRPPADVRPTSSHGLMARTGVRGRAGAPAAGDRFRPFRRDRSGGAGDGLRVDQRDDPGRQSRRAHVLPVARFPCLETGNGCRDRTGADRGPRVDQVRSRLGILPIQITLFLFPASISAVPASHALSRPEKFRGAVPVRPSAADFSIHCKAGEAGGGIEAPETS